MIEREDVQLAIKYILDDKLVRRYMMNFRREGHRVYKIVNDFKNEWTFMTMQEFVLTLSFGPMPELKKKLRRHGIRIESIWNYTKLMLFLHLPNVGPTNRTVIRRTNEMKRVVQHWRGKTRRKLVWRIFWGSHFGTNNPGRSSVSNPLRVSGCKNKNNLEKSSFLTFSRGAQLQTM